MEKFKRSDLMREELLSRLHSRGWSEKIAGLTEDRFAQSGQKSPENKPVLFLAISWFFPLASAALLVLSILFRFQADHSAYQTGDNTSLTGAELEFLVNISMDYLDP